MGVRISQRGREVAGLLCLVAFVMAGLALASFHALDPSFNVVGAPEEYANAIGRVGAYAADLLFQSFGLAAYLVPLPLVVLGVKLIAGSRVQEPFLRTLAFLGLLSSAAALATLAEPPVVEQLDFAPGGAVGTVLASVAVDWLNQLGAYLSLGTLLLISVVLLTPFSVNRTAVWAHRHVAPRLGSIKADRADWSEIRPLASARRESEELFAEPIPKSKPTRPSILERKSPPAEEVAGISISPPRTEPAGEFVPSEEPGEPVPFLPPPLDFLTDPPAWEEIDEHELQERAQLLQAKCAEFGVLGQVEQIRPGPVVTTFEFKPDAGVRYSKILNLDEDLCLALRAESIRIERIPGKNTVGIEVPNLRRRVIYLKEILSSKEFRKATSPLSLALGQRINGEPFVTDLGKMPHLLIAGSTGSGKSVALNCMVCSILFKSSPEEVRFILVDPKRLELGLYEGIPHLLTPIVTDPKQAANALNWAVREMEERYRLLAGQGVRNIHQFNALARDAAQLEEGELFTPLPNVVIIVDELADLMMTAGKDVELAVTRLAQMARAVGIHLILATQRPSVDVITGLIKANFPCRISFRVSSKVDSRTILDGNGAEQLLGRGDMLFLSPESRRLVRIHGAYVSEKEIARVVSYLHEQAAPEYREEILLDFNDEEDDATVAGAEGPADPLYDEAARFVVGCGKASTSLLQRRFRIGYGRAARLLDVMEHEGLVGPPEGSRPREVLVPSDYFEELEN